MYQNDYSYTAPVPQTGRNYSLQETAARNLHFIKEFCRRPQVLVLAILFTASFVMTIVSGVVNVDEMSRELASMFDIRRYSEYQSFRSGYIGTLIVSSIFSVLILAALWIIHLRSRSNNPSANPLAGFTIIRVLAIIEIVFLCLGALILFITFGVMASIPDDTGYAAAIMSVGIVVLLIALAVMLLFVISQLVFAGSFKKSLYSPYLLSKGSVLFGVMMILSALASLSSIFSVTASVQYLQEEYSFTVQSGGSPLMIISTLLNTAFAVCAAVCAFTYNEYVKKVNLQIQSGYPQSSVPPYMGDPSQAAPYQGYDNQQDYTNPYYPQQGYYPYQQQTDYTNPYQQPAPAQDYTNPYQQPAPAQDYTNPYQQPAPAQDYTNPYQQPAPAQDYANPYQQPQPSEQESAPTYQQDFAPLPYQQPAEPNVPQQQDAEVPLDTEAPEKPEFQAPVEDTATPQDTVEDTGRRTCPVCGEQAGPGVQECPRCGMKL